MRLEPKSVLGCAFGFLRRRRFLAALYFSGVDAGEIDHIKQKRRIAAIARGVCNDAAGEGEKNARAFDQKNRVQLLFGHILNFEDASIFQLGYEHHRFVRLRRRIDLQDHFELIIGALLGVKIHANLNVRFRIQTSFAILNSDIFKRQIAHILRLDRNFRGEFRFFCHDLSFALKLSPAWLPTTATVC